MAIAFSRGRGELDHRALRQDLQADAGHGGQHAFGSGLPDERTDVGHDVHPGRARVLEVAHHQLAAAGQGGPVEQPQPVPGDVGTEPGEITEAVPSRLGRARHGMALVRLALAAEQSRRPPRRSSGTGCTVMVALGPTATGRATRPKVSKHHSRIPRSVNTPRVSVGAGKRRSIAAPLSRCADPQHQGRIRQPPPSRPAVGTAMDPVPAFLRILQPDRRRPTTTGGRQGDGHIELAPHSASLVARTTPMRQFPRARRARDALCTIPVTRTVTSASATRTNSSAPEEDAGHRADGYRSQRDEPRVVSARRYVRCHRYSVSLGAPVSSTLHHAGRRLSSGNWRAHRHRDARQELGDDEGG